MSTVINPRDVRVVRQAQQLELQVKKGLAVALSVDVTDLNGGQLRQCRNQIWKLQHSAVENSPEAKALIKRAIAERGRELDHDETREILRPR